ncbi:hypothetical protein M2475_002093 [Breznakia sp. PF5-3]|nr:MULTISPECIES: hypothetical protein [unclassified Breznakia]MDF9825677.1 hypothetical protein [Breznakia sp. PM6-1]MDF9836512.1 hypothetical protein [Breznakia sp. PF5-3]
MSEVEIHIEIYNCRKKIRRAKVLLIFLGIAISLSLQAVMPSLFGYPYFVETSKNHYLYSLSSDAGFPAVVLWFSILWFGILLPIFIYYRIVAKLMMKYLSILLDQCDSILFEDIMSYGYEFLGTSTIGITMLKYYIAALSVNNKDEEVVALIEKPSILRYIKRDKYYYLNAHLYVAKWRENMDEVDRYYTLICEYLMKSKRK